MKFHTLHCDFFLGERVQFSQAISTSEARGAVEKWLLQVQQVQKIHLLFFGC